MQTDWAGIDLAAWNAIDFYHPADELEDDELLDDEQEMEYEVLFTIFFFPLTLRVTV